MGWIARFLIQLIKELSNLSVPCASHPLHFTGYHCLWSYPLQITSCPATGTISFSKIQIPFYCPYIWKLSKAPLGSQRIVVHCRLPAHCYIFKATLWPCPMRLNINSILLFMNCYKWSKTKSAYCLEKPVVKNHLPTRHFPIRISAFNCAYNSLQSQCSGYN